MRLLSGSNQNRAHASVCEQLESRFLLSAYLRNGTLKIYGTPGDDDITLWYTKGKFNVSINNVVQSFDSLLVKSSRIEAGDGDDWINLWSKLPGNILGGLGDDTIVSGDGPDLLDGGDGNDHLAGKGGNDTILGCARNDALWGGLGNDSLSGGDGNDILIGDDGIDTLMGDAGDDDIN